MLIARDGRIADQKTARLILPVAVVTIAVVAGGMTALVGTTAGFRAIYYLGVLGALGVLGFVALTLAEPLRFGYLVLLLCMPLSNIIVPPGRFGMSLFDTATVLLMLGFLGKKLILPTSGPPLFPTKSLLFGWLLVVPCLLFSQYPTYSLQIFVILFAAYVYFLFTLDELGRERGFERITRILSITLIVLALGLFIDHFLHINLSLRGSNLNQVTELGGRQIYRAGGFFQDPQRAGAFLAALITFLLLVAVRKRFTSRGVNLLLRIAVLLGMAGLLTTISRAAIASCLVVSAGVVFLFNRWPAPVKLAVSGGAVLLAATFALIPDLWLALLPTAIVERFASMHEGLQTRIEIWFDTWDMFADHPLTGIGLGSFQSYFSETRPGVLHYLGIGEETGVIYVPDQPESGYFKILYEGGIFGTIAALVLIGDTLRRALALLVNASIDAATRTEIIAALAALVTLGTTFVTVFTLTDARLMALLAILLAVIWRRSLQYDRPAPKP